jgi:alpha-glucuronidase
LSQTAICILWVFAAVLHAETGYNAWLRYTPLEGSELRQYRASVPAVVTSIGQEAPVTSARDETIRGLRGMLGRTLRIESDLSAKEGAIVLGTLDDLRKTAPQLHLDAALGPDGYWLKTSISRGVTYTVVAGANSRGVLYGAFALLRKIGLGEPIGILDEKQSPRAPIRWINQWDNLDGSIERGYGGRSIFWDNGRVRADLTRVGDYGRMLASLGINACAINNVNANPRVLGRDFIPQVKRIAEALRPWGVRVALSVDFGSPKTVGGLDTFDPLDPGVAAWWKTTTDTLFREIPDLAGFVLKADSEGRVGPSFYKRTHADAANAVARALKPHNAVLLYRGFVYDHRMDWRDPKNDRARAAYDNFKPIDGQFDDNAIVQIKNGPIDFQVREPVSPLFGALEKTHEAIELQVTQEYMGQGRHLVFLAPQWKETLDFDMQAHGPDTPVKSLVTGFVGVANAGLDDNWFGSTMSQANLYGFGRLAWDPNLSSRRIALEWARLTFGSDPNVLETVAGMQLNSWRSYEGYTGPLGLQTLTDIVGNHYGVSVEASERNGWGQWHRADEQGVGMDRTVATGTGYIGQYREPVARIYESPATCPDELLLFFHHVPYTHVLHSGNTVIQYLYDSHYEGAAAAERFVRRWEVLRGHVDDQRYGEVLAQLEYQAGRAVVWRDAVDNWFLRASGIPDKLNRVGHHPGRVEAEAMKLDGYSVVDVTPWEAASGGKGISCPKAKCSASFRYEGDSGWYRINVEYFDQNDGVAHYRVLVAGQPIADWAASDRVPTRKMDGSSSTRRAIGGVALRRGDEIRIEGVPDGGESAALDYVEIQPMEER